MGTLLGSKQMIVQQSRRCPNDRLRSILVICFVRFGGELRVRQAYSHLVDVTAGIQKHLQFRVSVKVKGTIVLFPQNERTTYHGDSSFLQQFDLCRADFYAGLMNASSQKDQLSNCLIIPDDIHPQKSMRLYRKNLKKWPVATLT